MKQSELDPIQELRRLVLDEGTQAKAAKVLGVPAPTVSELLHKRQLFSARMLKKLGLKRIVVRA